MKLSKIVEAMGYIDDDLITASIDYKPRRIRLKWIPYAAAAACAACLCVFAVRFSNYDPATNNGTLASGNCVNAGSASSVSAPPASEVSGNSNTSEDLTASSNSGDPNTSGTPNTSDTINSSGTSNSSQVFPPSTGGGDPPPTGGGDPPSTGGGGEVTGNGKPAYDGVFKGINNDGLTNEPIPYDEMMEMMNSQRENNIFLDSFYLVETIRALPIDDSQQLNGWGSVCEGKTIYEVRILKDLISDEETNRTEKILIANGTAEWQKNGDPVYAPGERFTAALTKPKEGDDFLQTPLSTTLRYDVAEDENGGIILYSRGSELDKLKLPSSVDISETVITSTTLNPAIYTQKLDLNALADFLREDWKKRGVSSHFENAQSSNSSENVQDSRNTRQTASTEDKLPVGSSPNAYLSTRSATFSEAKEQVKFVDVKEVSGADFIGYELDYIMPSETLFALNYVYTDGFVLVRDNSGDCGVIKISPEHDEKIERDNMVFWKSKVTDPHAAIYISESDIAYFGMFRSDTDLSKAIDTIKSLL